MPRKWDSGFMVVKLRSAIGIAMIWLAAVAGVSVTAWVAIDRAGRDVTGVVVSSLPLATVTSAGTTATPDGGPSRTDATRKPTATREPSPSSEPSVTREPSATQAPPASTKPATPTPAPAPPTSVTHTTSVTPRDRTVSVAGGQVSVRCTGETILLRIAQPENGWRVEVDKSGPVQVDVSFRRGDDESAAATQVMAVCTNGTPTFKISNDS